MIKQVFSVFDHAASAFCPPFYMSTEHQAIRAMEVTLQDTSTNLSQWPQDYSLYHLGEFDDVKGSMKCEVPKLVINCLALKNQIARREEESKK